MLGKRLDGSDQPENPLAALAGKEFTSWHIMGRKEFPKSPDGKLQSLTAPQEKTPIHAETWRRGGSAFSDMPSHIVPERIEGGIMR